MPIPLLALGGLMAGAAGVQAGGSIWSSLIQRDAAKEATAIQSDALQNSRRTLQDAQGNALSYLDPFRQYGLNAGAAMQGLLYSPDQINAQIDAQRAQLQGEVDRLTAALPVWERFPILTGKNASERRAAMFTEQYNAGQTALSQAQAKLNSFEQQAKSMQAQAAQGGPKIEASPWYKFQSELLGRDMDRFFAARGLTGSGFEAEERRKGLIQLGAQETDKQFSRMNSLYTTGASAASQGANILTSMGTQIANNQTAQGAVEAQGILGAADATTNMISGVTNAVTGNLAKGMEYGLTMELFDSLKRANATGAAGGAAVTQYGNGVGGFTSGGNNFLVNLPH